MSTSTFWFTDTFFFNQSGERGSGKRTGQWPIQEPRTKKKQIEKKIDFLVQKNELAGEVKCLPSFCGWDFDSRTRNWTRHCEVIKLNDWVSESKRRNILSQIFSWKKSEASDTLLLYCRTKHMIMKRSFACSLAVRPLKTGVLQLKDLPNKEQNNWRKKVSVNFVIFEKKIFFEIYIKICLLMVVLLS